MDRDNPAPAQCAGIDGALDELARALRVLPHRIAVAGTPGHAPRRGPVFAVNCRETDGAPHRFIDNAGASLLVLRDRHGAVAQACGVRVIPRTRRDRPRRPGPFFRDRRSRLVRAAGPVLDGADRCPALISFVQRTDP